MVSLNFIYAFVILYLLKLFLVLQTIHTLSVTFQNLQSYD
jgi:hypothetical protein